MFHDTLTPYQTYRVAMTPYLRCMVTLAQLFRTAGMTVTPQGAVIITDPHWTNIPALLVYRHAAHTIARLRHAACQASHSGRGADTRLDMPPP